MEKNQEINLNKSFVYASAKLNTMRLNIKSVLFNKSEKKTFFLTKECRAESVGNNPLFKTQRYEYLPIFSDNGEFITLRNQAIDTLFKPRKNHKYQILRDDKVVICKIDLDYSKIKILDFNSLNNKLKDFSKEEFFCKIEYSYKEKEYYCIFKCDYLNFDYDKNSKRENTSYIQPINGYIPFEKNGKIFASYMARYISNNNDGNLDILLRNHDNLFDISGGNIIKRVIKLTLNSILFFIKKNDFNKYITIKKSKITFFQYE